ncbi:hypothetical protein BHE74_00018943, partial [Ensete ventricosum]
TPIGPSLRSLLSASRSSDAFRQVYAANRWAIRGRERALPNSLPIATTPTSGPLRRPSAPSTCHPVIPGSDAQWAVARGWAGDRCNISGVLEPVELEEERVPSPRPRRGLFGSRISFRNNGFVLPLRYHRKSSTLSFVAAAIKPLYGGGGGTGVAVVFYSADPSVMTLPGAAGSLGALACSSSDDRGKKARKPYTITPSRGRAGRRRRTTSSSKPSNCKHPSFLLVAVANLYCFHCDWKNIEAFVGSKTVIQFADNIVNAGALTIRSSCYCSTTDRPSTWPSYDTVDQEDLHVMPDFAQVYSFLGSVFELNTSGHLQKLKAMDPMDV